MRLSNVEIADTLNLSQSTVSRMRTGERIASIETLQAICEHYGVEPATLMAAASKAGQGDVTEWVEILSHAFDDGEPDPDAAEPSEPEYAE